MKARILITCLLLLAISAKSQTDLSKQTKIPNGVILNSTASDSSFNSGVLAAKEFYRGYKGAATGTLIATIISPILGLAPAIGTTSGVPGDLMHPSYDRLKNLEYFNGYTSEAKRIKSRKVWNKYLLGFGIDVGIAGIIYGAILISNNQSRGTTYNRVIPGF